jgi:cation:H+ antiporter
MDWMIVLYLLGGFIILMAGAEGLVRGASSLAAALGISPLVIGLTVVAFGTSAPELAVSVQSAYRGTMDVAVGNVVGSNIFNILLILGISAVITPLIVNSQLLRLDVPLMIVVSFIFYFMALDGVISRLDGLLLFGGLLLYIWWSIRKSRQEQEGKEEDDDEYSQKDGGVFGYVKNVAFVVVGLAMLVVGSDWLVEGATALARLFNVSDLIIGLTIVALGTSLPELATSIVAAIRKERDIAVGNVVGSNFFNIMAVIGLSGLVAPVGVEVSAVALQFDIPVMLFVSVLAFPILFIDGRISRWEGALMLVLLAAYITYLVFISIPYPPGAQILATIMLWFVVPFTCIVIGINVFLQVRRRKRQ